MTLLLTPTTASTASIPAYGEQTPPAQVAVGERMMGTSRSRMQCSYQIQAAQG